MTSATAGPRPVRKPRSSAAHIAAAPPMVDVEAAPLDTELEGKAGPSKQVAPTEDMDGPVFEPVAEKIPHHPMQMAVKRCADVGLSALALAGAAPALGLVALAIKLDSEGPVLYKQVRVGRNGQLFDIYKFRSMYTDAERGGPRWARSNDTRVTRVGGVLRRTSIDELPQLWNILIGDMSLVGPRPERPVFVSRFRQTMKDYDLRHVVRPGLSGWAQVNGLRGNVSIESRTERDVHYVRNFSLLLDVRILFRTFSAVVAGE